MKRLLFTILVFCGITTHIKAQNPIPNSGFEEWDSIPGIRPYWEPRGYRTKNSVFQTQNRIYTFRSTESHTGNYSLLITPAIDTLIGPRNSWVVMDTISIDSVKPYFDTSYGVFTLHAGGLIKRLCGWYKYVPDTTTPVPWRRNPALGFGAGVNDEIYGISICGGGSITFSIPQNEFTYFCINYDDLCLPHLPYLFSLAIEFTSRNRIQEPAGKLWLDDLVLEVEPTAVASVEERMLTLYPNPGKDVLYLHSNALPVSHIEMYDMQGSKVLQQKDISQPLQVQHLPPGVYNLRCQVGSQWVNRRWVKE